MAKVLVTGALGFIGRRLCAALEAEGHAVWRVHRPGRADQPAGPYALPCDLAQPIDPTRWPSAMDVVIHLAQSSRFRELPEGLSDVFRVNVGSTMSLLEYARCAQVRLFIYASSGGVYGFGSDRAWAESEPVLSPVADEAYLASKRAAEAIALSYRRWLPVTILRPFFVYGPNQQPDRLIPRLIDSVREGRSIALEGAEGLVINPLYVDEAVGAIVRAVDVCEPLTVNLAGPEVVSLRQIVERIGEALGRSPIFEVRQPPQRRALLGATEVLRLRLGLEPKIAIREGLHRTLQAVETTHRMR